MEDGTVEIPLAVEIANGAAPYHLNPMYTSFGGYVFGGGAGNYDVSDIGLDSPEGLAAADQQLAHRQRRSAVGRHRR